MRRGNETQRQSSASSPSPSVGAHGPSLTGAAQAGAAAGRACARARRFASVVLDSRRGALRRAPGEHMFEPAEDEETAPNHFDRRGFFRGAAALTVGGFGAAAEVATPEAQTNRA